MDETRGELCTQREGLKSNQNVSQFIAKVLALLIFQTAQLSTQSFHDIKCVLQSSGNSRFVLATAARLIFISRTGECDRETITMQEDICDEF